MTPNRSQLTPEELAAAVEALRARATPSRLDAVMHALRGMGIDPATMKSLPQEESDNDENE